MLRRVLVTMSAASALLAGSMAAAGPASAAIERCSTPKAVQNGVTIRTCITASVTLITATTSVYYNQTTQFGVAACARIFRNDTLVATYCPGGDTLSPGNSVYRIAVTEPNPSGTQKWYSTGSAQTVDASANVQSPNLYDT